MLNQGCSNCAPENAAGEGACFAHGEESRGIKTIAAASLFRLVSNHAKGSGNLPLSACRQLGENCNVKKCKVSALLKYAMPISILAIKLHLIF